MSDSRVMISSTVDAESFYMQVIRICPTSNCSGNMRDTHEHTKDEISPSKTISYYTIHSICDNCGYKTQREVVTTTNFSSLDTKFEDMVFEMRRAQKKYFETRDKRWLIESKKLESAVDKHLKDREQYSFNFDDI